MLTAAFLFIKNVQAVSHLSVIEPRRSAQGVQQIQYQKAFATQLLQLLSWLVFGIVILINREPGS